MSLVMLSVQFHILDSIFTKVFHGATIGAKKQPAPTRGSPPQTSTITHVLPSPAAALANSAFHTPMTIGPLIYSKYLIGK